MLLNLSVVASACWVLASCARAADTASIQTTEKIITHKLHRRTSTATGKLSAISATDAESHVNMVLVADVLSSRANTDGFTATGLIDQDGNDVSYYIEAQFGSDKQNFSVVVDTGSYYTWVYGANCTSDVCSEHRSYNLKNSSTVQIKPYTFKIQYSSGSVSGSVVNDIISFSGFQTRVDFGLADSAGSTFSSFPIDGIMGLSAKDVSGNEFPGILNTLYNQSLIEKRVFGVNLGRSSESGDEGSITFGGLDSTKYSGDISYTPVIGESVLWNINLTHTYMGAYELDFGGARSAIVDTGTTLLVLPPDDALKLHSYIQGAQTDGTNFAVPCSTNITLQLGIAGRNWTISPKDYVGSKLDSDNNICISNIQGVSSQGNTTWILGDVFLKNVYSAFDVDQQRVGFADKVIADTNATPEDSIVYSALSLVSSESVTATSTIVASVTAAGGNQKVEPSSSSSSSFFASSTLVVSTTSASHATTAESTASSTSAAASASTSSMKNGANSVRSVHTTPLIAVFAFALIWMS